VTGANQISEWIAKRGMRFTLLGISPALFLLLGQKKRPRPLRLSWRNSLRKYFGFDPLIDSRNQTMRWVRQLKPVAG
jgi:hypothetical protein